MSECTTEHDWRRGDKEGTRVCIRCDREELDDILDRAFSVVVAFATNADDVPEALADACEGLRDALPYDAFEHSRRKSAPACAHLRIVNHGMGAEMRSECLDCESTDPYNTAPKLPSEQTTSLDASLDHLARSAYECFDRLEHWPPGCTDKKEGTIHVIRKALSIAREYEQIPPFGQPGLCNAQLSRADSDLCTKKRHHKGICENR